MKEYRIICEVKNASGWQSWIVEAESEEEALKKYEDGYAMFEDVELEATSFCEPEIEEI